MDEKIKEGIESLQSLRDEHIQVAEIMLKADAALYGLDLLGNAILNRSIALIDGFCTLMESQNYSCAVSLVRLQLDSIIRFFGATLVDDPHRFSLDVLAGKSVRDMRDRNGKRMTDRYLLNKVAEHYPWMPKVYDSTSGFIHLSEKHIFATIQEAREDRTITIAVGPGDKNVPLDIKLEAIEAMHALTRALFDFIANWVITKRDPEGTARYWRDKEQNDV